jgi:hypothetical protein
VSILAIGQSGVQRLVLGVVAFVIMAGAVVLNPAQVYADFCSINGRDCYIGYFTGVYDGGDTVRRKNVITAPAMLNVNDANGLIGDVGGHLGCGGGVVNNTQNGTGAAFIVLTMLSYPPGTPKNVACQVFGEWAATVQAWAPYTNYNVFYNFGGLNTRSSVVDVAYYQSDQFEAWSIVFYSPTTGQPLYAIKKDCANPVGRLQGLPRSYILSPYVNDISPTPVESGSKMSVNSRVDNAGEVNSQPTHWELTQLTVQPGKKAPHEDEDITVSPEAPCQSVGGNPTGNYFNSADSSCKNVIKGDRVFNLGSTSINYPPAPPPVVEGIGIGDIPVGSKVCYVLSVQPRANNDSKWAHSKPKCSVVGKKPKLQIWGGDVAVRGSIETSTSVKTINGTTKTFGSWVEYGVFSVGLNSRFASGSGLIDQIDNNQTAWSKLTFANDQASSNILGQYAPAGGFRPLPGVASFFAAVQNKVAIGSPSVDISGLTFANGGPIQVHTAGNLTITGGSIPAGRSVVIIASGTVTIDGNISYTDGALGKLQDIPQVVIIAQAINIRDSVTHIDSWLVAAGTINTCYNFTGNLTSGKCASKLEVNGPVIAGKILLNRTAGSETGPASGDPGERFNLRPDAHLWGLMQSRGASKAQTVYSVELPPRF